MAEDIADIVVAGLPGRKAGRFEPLERFWNMLDGEPLHLDIGAGGDVDDAVAELVGDEGNGPRLFGNELATGKTDAEHVSAGAIALAIERAIPLHPLEVGGLDVGHGGPRLRVTQNVGPDIETVLLRLPDFN